MDRLITATEANQRFSEMLRDVQSGESFVVTSRGEPVAKIVPFNEGDMKAQAERSATLLGWLREQRPRVIGPWTRGDLYE